MQPAITRKLEYQDGFSAIAIWWKSIFMAPFWATIVIPVLGAFALVFVNQKSIGFYESPGWQISLAATIAACMIYFLHDLLKRTIYFKNNQIIFGLRRYSLDRLISIGVEYKSEQLMAKRIIFRFRDGKMLRLNVSRLRYHEFESVLHLIETRLPQVQIDPVILTLMRCRRSAGKAISDSGDSVEIRYESRFALKELGSVFARTWDEWSSFGPVLGSAILIPCWSMWIAQLFMWPVLFLNGHSNSGKPELSAMLVQLWTDFFTALSHIFTQDKAKVVVDLAGNPYMVILLSVLVVALIVGLIRTLIRPNRIIVQADAIRLVFRLGSHALFSNTVPVDSIESIKLHKPHDLADPSSWKLRFALRNGKHVNLELAALSSEEKTRLTKSIQRLAPQIPVDAALLEAMIPRQDRSYTELWLQSLSAAQPKPARRCSLLSYTELWLQSLSAAPERRSLEPLQPGQLLSNQRYQVIRCLGVGGQGTAYLAKDTALVESHLNELVVLKESIFPIFADSAVRMQALERFEKEAKLLKRLEHRGIVSLRDYFLEDHRGYLVMEHVDGKSLKQLVQEEGSLPELRVRDLGVQMCDILEYLHASGVIHRDFTPDNLILGRDGQLKLIDFNVAQQAEVGSTGTIVGKQSYLPPEQFRGKSTSQSDLYALGATLHFLLTGEEPEPISQSSPIVKGASCSESLDKTVRDCTALALSKRIGTALAVKLRLQSRTLPSAPEDSQPEETEGTSAEDNGTVIDLEKDEVFEMENA